MDVICGGPLARGLSPQKIMTVLRNEIVNLMKQKRRTDWRLEGLKEGGVGIWQRTSGINWAYRLEKIPNGAKIETELRNVHGCKI